MKKYMLLTKTEDFGVETGFFDNYADAKNTAIDCECGLGGYWEIYERMPIDPEYPEAGNAYAIIES